MPARTAPGKCRKPGSTDTSQRTAERIVDGILAAVDRAGRFEGSGKDRRLTFGLLVTRDGRTDEVRDRLVRWTREQLSRR